MASVIPSNDSVEECAKDLGAMQLQQPKAEPPPRASFLGLPVELRLEVYAFLASSITLRTTKSRRFGTHMLARPTSCCGMLSSDLSVLAVNKQISVEARSIIYQILELSPGVSFIPWSMSQHVRNLFVLCDSLEEGWLYDRTFGQPGPLSCLWPRVRWDFPNIRQVRLRVDHAIHGSVHRFYQYGGCDAASPGNITEMASLRRVIVESYVRGDGRKSMRAKLLLDYIRAEVKCYGLKIEVLERFLMSS